MSELVAKLVALLPVGMDFDGAIVSLIKAFPIVTRQEIKVSLLRCVARCDAEVATELGIAPALSWNTG